MRKMDYGQFYSMLNRKFGILPPDKYTQDWQWECGKWEQTEDYISFYNDHVASLNSSQKYDLINMIIQGFDDMFIECLNIDTAYREKIWSKIKDILIKDKQTHMETIKYWSCLNQSLDDSFRATKYIRELL